MVEAARYDSFHDGYWWAISIHQEDDEPEIIDVRGSGANRLLGQAEPYELVEFIPLKPIDTTGWPTERKLAEDENLDEDREVDPDTVVEGYWWAFHFMEDEPEIIRVGVDKYGSKGAYRADSDGEEELALFDFVMKIDTSDWPQE
jgi:hypothetical protein